MTSGRLRTMGTYELQRETLVRGGIGEVFAFFSKGTAVLDHVRYAVLGGPVLERLVQRFLVGPDGERIFDYRQRRLEELFATP